MHEQEIRVIVAAVLEKLQNEEYKESYAPIDSQPDLSLDFSLCSPSESLEDITLKKKAIGVKNPQAPAIVKEFSNATAARVTIGKVGSRPPFNAYIAFLADHARSKNTVFKEVPDEWLEKNELLSVQTCAEDKNVYLTRPDLGRVLSDASLEVLKKHYPEPKQVLVIVSDGLSTDALLSNYEEILPPLMKGLKNAGLSVFKPFFLRYGRVKAEDVLGQALGAEVVIMLVGERPGLGQSESMSCYAVYSPSSETIESDRTVISNIHRGGIPPVEAAAVIVELAQNMIKYKASGLQLNRKLEAD